MIGRKTSMAAMAATILAVVGAALTPAFADGGPATPRGALARGEVKAAPPPPPKAAPVAPQKAAPVAQPPATIETAPATPPAPIGARTGQISLDEGVVLTVPQGWAFWPPSEAQSYLRRTQTVAPSGRILGMISPADLRPSDSIFWGSVVSFNPIGRVAEERAERLSAVDFMDETRSARPTTAPRLIGFPVAPAYDASRKALTWGERYDPAAPGAAERPLRLEQRVLGRRGVAALSTPAKSDQLAQFTAYGQTLGGMLGFSPGSAYIDATPGDSTPLFDLPGVITNRPKSSGVSVAGSSGSGIQGTPLTSGGDGATAEVAGEAGPGGGLLGLLNGWFQWIAVAVVLLGALPWLIFQKRGVRDANLQVPRG